MDGGTLTPLRWATAWLLASALAVVLPVQAAKKKPAALPQTMEHKVSRPGSYVWEPDRSPDGAVLVVVSLPEQRAHIYRDGKRIGLTTISTGSEGRETPPGQFEILQKKVTHRSNLYDDAPMPFMQRLTWDGIALHAGKLPGYPASHGCIRLPDAFAKLLFEEEPQRLRQLEEAIRAQDWSREYEVVASAVNLLEITARGANKGGMVRRLAELLGVRQENVCCVGDHANDIPMLEYAGMAFAPENAIPAVHRVPGIRILPDCRENAMAAMIAVLDRRYS